MTDKSKIIIQLYSMDERGMPRLEEAPILRSAFLAFQFVMPDGQRLKIAPDEADGIQVFSTTGRIQVLPYAANAILVKSVGPPDKPTLVLDPKDEEKEG